MAHLAVVGTTRRFALRDVTTIGRDPANDVCLGDGMVSARHAEIRRTNDGSFEVVDLGSRRGTFLGGRRVTTARLAAADEILIGITRLRVELSDSVANHRGGEDAGPRDESGSWATRVQRRLDATREPSVRPAAEIGDAVQLRRDYERLRIAMEFTRSIGLEHDPMVLLDRILAGAFQLFPAERGAIILLDKGGSPTLQRSQLRSGEETTIAISTSMMSEIIATRSGVLISDAVEDIRFQRARSLAMNNVRSAMCVPMLFQAEILGVMQLDARGIANMFTEKDLGLFSTLMSQAALALKNATLVTRVQTVVSEEWKRLGRVVHALRAGVVLLDANRRVVLANDLAEEMLPLLGDVRRGRPLERVGPVAIEELLERAADRPVEISIGAPRRVFSVSSSQSAVQATAEVETILVLRDVTDEREREERAAQQERLALVGQLAAGVGHDFNNLLAVVLNYGQFIVDASEGQTREDAQEVCRAAVRATELTRQLLAFSRREVVKPRVVELNDLVGGMEKLLRRALGEQVTLEAALGADVPLVKVDPSKLENVLLNLAVNARDAMPAGGALRIATACVHLDGVDAKREGLDPGRYAEISVGDTGAGMTPEIAARVFEPFFTTKGPGRGTGLGLASAYGIVKQAQGEISLRSQPGVGTTFRILLPATDGVASIEELGSLTLSTAQARGTILIAEDEPAVRQLTRRILEQSGYVVLEAANGAEAISLLDRPETAIDLLLTDLVMPGISGKELAEHVWAMRSGSRVLFMSGYVDGGIAREGVLDAEVAFIQKPFTRDLLLARVRQVLSGESPVVSSR